MAKAKHNWTAIKKDYAGNKYSNLKLLAEAHDVPYSYLKKKAAEWSKDPSFISEVIMDSCNSYSEPLPEDSEERVKLMFDKLSEIIMISLNAPAENFFTEDGRLKSKALLDTATAIEKVQKGYKEVETGEEDTGKLGQYADYIKELRDAANATKEVE